MPVHELRERPYTELLEWLAYFEQRPVGWREDSRIMTILQAMGIKAQPESVFMSLAKLKENRAPSKHMGLENSFLFKLMQNAEGGDPINCVGGLVD